jgi:hypothetical protein
MNAACRNRKWRAAQVKQATPLLLRERVQECEIIALEEVQRDATQVAEGKFEVKG